MRTSSIAAVLFVAVLFVAGCAQSPSSSMLSSAVTAPSSVDAKPSAYDGSGSWHFVAVISTRSGEELLRDEGDGTFTQDADGNLTSETEDGGQFTLIRRGKGFGPNVFYSASSVEPSSTGCGEDLSGTAQIDVATNTLEATLVGVLEGCDNDLTVVLTITATKTGI